jgi:hypothetical protein
MKKKEKEKEKEKEEGWLIPLATMPPPFWPRGWLNHPMAKK